VALSGWHLPEALQSSLLTQRRCSFRPEWLTPFRSLFLRRKSFRPLGTFIQGKKRRPEGRQKEKLLTTEADAGLVHQFQRNTKRKSM